MMKIIRERKCVVNNKLFKITELLRIVNVNNKFIIDKEYIIKTRGFYVKNDFETISKLLKSKILEREIKKRKILIKNLENFKKEMEEYKDGQTKGFKNTI